MTAGPRERLVIGAIELVRRNGVAGTGLAELLTHSGTARGSIYQHFPGGKDELVEASVRLAGDVMTFRADAQPRTPDEIVALVVASSRSALVESDFGLGCPVVAAATAGPEHAAVVAAAGEVFAAWTAALADALVSSGMPRGAAPSFAGLVISAVEGALVQARARRSTQPFDDVEAQLVTLARAHVTM
ncbi:TetR/AcrR family transcriptional regulator [Nocardioides humilatus]|uniref:TetR/AcrR family transcriptional regulator n=1 Tax=Nocardioides humilatus TaxID=2607660 RepID=UPI00165EFA1D|nr:TetR/AcrR family transcriptional regulator [Nocardioides humilatus]